MKKLAGFLLLLAVCGFSLGCSAAKTDAVGDGATAVGETTETAGETTETAGETTETTTTE